VMPQSGALPTNYPDPDAQYSCENWNIPLQSSRIYRGWPNVRPQYII